MLQVDDIEIVGTRIKPITASKAFGLQVKRIKRVEYIDIRRWQDFTDEEALESGAERKWKPTRRGIMIEIGFFEQVLMPEFMDIIKNGIESKTPND